MRDAYTRLELSSRQEQVLCEHVDDLSCGVISKAIAETSLPVTARHSDVYDLGPIADDVHAGLGRNRVPNDPLEPDEAREMGRDIRIDGHHRTQGVGALARRATRKVTSLHTVIVQIGGGEGIRTPG